MSDSAPGGLGSVVSLRRYPVKSMLGEDLNAAAVTERGPLEDRAYALVDGAAGKDGCARRPRQVKMRPGVAVPVGRVGGEARASGREVGFVGGRVRGSSRHGPDGGGVVAATVARRLR